MTMDCETITQRLRDMESRYANGFSSLDRSFLDSIYFQLFGRAITNTGCSNCYRDAYIEICTKLKRDNMMKSNTDFQLKAGAVITFFGSPKAYTNANLTDEVALRFLSLNATNVGLFSHLPSDLNERLKEYVQHGTNDNGVAMPASDNGQLGALEAELAEAKVALAATETERDNLRAELAGANESLEASLAERDRLAAEVEAIRAKTSTRKRKAPVAESDTPVTESSEQSLDFED